MLNIVKNTTFPSLLDLLMPHSCRGCGHVGNVLCDRCKNYIISQRINLCPQCKKPNKTGKCQKCKKLPPTYSIGFREGFLNDLIHDFKYHPIRALGPKFAELLDNSLPHSLDDVIIIPLPTATNHIRARGLDHTLLIAKHLARLRNYKVSKLLIRAKNTVQVGSDRKSRLTQASTAYAINPKISINPEITYLLLDDVWTTGASMQAAIKKLQQAGARKIIIALLAISCVNQ